MVILASLPLCTCYLFWTLIMSSFTLISPTLETLFVLPNFTNRE